MKDKFTNNSDKNNDNDFKSASNKRKTVNKAENLDNDIYDGYDNYGDDYAYDYDSYEAPINLTSKSKGRANSKRRRKKNTSVGISLRVPVLIIILSFIIVAAAALMLPVFNVVEVYCEGNSSIKTEDIITTAQLSVGKNIFLENLGSAKRRIEDINSVKSVDIRRVFPNKICITVEERIPAGYISISSGIALVSEDGIILSKYDGETSEKIKQNKTPTFVTGASDTNNTSESQKSDNKNNASDDTKNGENKNQNENNQSDKSKDKNQTENSENSENGENKSSDENDSSKDSNNSNNSNDSKNSSDGENKENSSSNTTNTENTQSDEFEKVPLINGITLSGDKEGEKVEAEDSDKLEKWFYLCKGLKGADLLNRTTYVNIENTEEITVVIENRLEVRLGKADNIDYRCKFLAEVINTKLGAAESAVLDYTGNDIYAIDRDDGGARVKKTDKKKDSETDKEKSNSKKSDSDDSEDSEDNGSDSDTDIDSDSTSSKSSSSKSSSASSSSKSSSKSSSSDEEDEEDNTVTSSSSKSSKSTSSTSSSSEDDEDL